MFTTIVEAVDFARSGAEIENIIKATLGGDKVASLGLLKTETLKAITAYALWNQASKTERIVATVKALKQTKLCREYLRITTALIRDVPLNRAGDIKRIANEEDFIEKLNEAISGWDAAWVKHAEEIEAAKAATAAKKAKAPSMLEEANTKIVELESQIEAARGKDVQLAIANEELAQEKIRSESALRTAREARAELAAANAKIIELESQLASANARIEELTKTKAKTKTKAVTAEAVTA